MREMDKELADIISFYMRKEAETLARLEVGMTLNGGGERNRRVQ